VDYYTKVLEENKGNDVNAQLPFNDWNAQLTFTMHQYGEPCFRLIQARALFHSTATRKNRIFAKAKRCYRNSISAGMLNVVGKSVG
jgi:hypothetical protein